MVLKVCDVTSRAGNLGADRGKDSSVVGLDAPSIVEYMQHYQVCMHLTDFIPMHVTSPRYILKYLR